MNRFHSIPQKLPKTTASATDALAEGEAVSGIDPFAALVGADPMFRRLLETAREIALTGVSVLIRGETGTGKNLLARAVHAASRRRAGPLSTSCCATLRGLDFEPTSGGTVVLDEISDLASTEQDRLCHLLDSATCPDVRWIALTHRDLEELIRSKERFRAGLYYRLRVVTLDLPPLRRRSGDVEILLRTFLGELSERHRRHPPHFGSSAKKVLRRYRWPGNVRELRNFCEQMVLTRSHRELGAEDLPLALRFPGRPQQDTAELPPGGVHLDDWIADLIRQALVKSGGNCSRAARLLGITRDTFNYRVKKYGIQKV